MSVTNRIEIPVPHGSKILLIQLPSRCTQREADAMAIAMSKRTFEHWRDHPNEPAILVVSNDVIVRWLEAEAPEPAAVAQPPKQQRARKR